MNRILEPLLAILAIVAPLGLAYAVLLLQSRKPCRKASATTRDDLRHKKLFRAEEKNAAR